MSLTSRDRVSSATAPFSVSRVSLAFPGLDPSSALIDTPETNKRVLRQRRSRVIRIYIYPPAAKISVMDARLLDVIIGLSGFLILIVMLAVLPRIMMAGFAYLAAIVIFIMFLSGAGYS